MTILEEKILDLKGQLTGNMFNDMAIKEAIHKLEMERNNVSINCSLDNDDCEACGS